jgi:transposase
MRRGFEGLSALVRQELRRDPLDGAFYLFTNQQRNRAKVLHFDGSGLCVLAKRLERGRFAKLWRSEDSSELKLTRTELDLFLQGSHLVGRVPLSPPPLGPEALRPRAPRHPRVPATPTPLFPASTTDSAAA